MTSILFVCSGNIFRSLVAEYALKAQLGSRVGYLIGSAGIEALPQEIHPVVLARTIHEYLLRRPILSPSGAVLVRPPRRTACTPALASRARSPADLRSRTPRDGIHE